MNTNKVVNNANRLVKQLEKLNLPKGATVWQDDGNVGVQFDGSVEQSNRLVEELVKNFGCNPVVGDGVQEGSFWFQNESKGLFGELQDFVK